jgi:hypothetical protein
MDTAVDARFCREYPISPGKIFLPPGTIFRSHRPGDKNRPSQNEMFNGQADIGKKRW